MKGRKAAWLSACPLGWCERSAGSFAQFIWLVLSSSDLWDDELQCTTPDHVTTLPDTPVSKMEKTNF